MKIGPLLHEMGFFKRGVASTVSRYVDFDVVLPAWQSTRSAWQSIARTAATSAAPSAAQPSQTFGAHPL